MRSVAVFAKRSIIDVWQCSEYVSDSKYAMVLNMLLVLNISGFWICHGSKYARVLNILFQKYKKAPFPET